MNLILLHPTDFIKNKKDIVQLTGRRFKHILTILRAQKGDELKTGLLNSKLGTGIITEIDDTHVEMEVALETAPPPPLPVSLFVALPRPKTVKKIVQSATALGVKQLFFFKTWRVEKSYLQSPVLYEESIKNLCLLGLEQAGDTVMPQIEFRHLFKSFIEDEVPDLIKNRKAFVSHPGAKKQLPKKTNGAHVCIAIGPEGGFIDYEINMLAEKGFKPVSLGKRIQRVEWTVPFILGRLF